MSWSSKILSRRSDVQVLLFVFILIVSAGLPFALLLVPKISLSKEISITTLALLPPLIVAVSQLFRTLSVQYAAHIKDFLMEFQRSERLFNAYHDLVYTYTDSTFDEVLERATERVRRVPALPPKPVFHWFDDLQNDRSADLGNRFYHPKYFQFSLEERRLDALLDYFNAVGLYYRKRLILIDDIVSILGDYLAVIADRAVVKFYLELCQDAEQWPYDERVGAATPFSHLIALIAAFKEYNRNRERIERVERQIRQFIGMNRPRT